MLKKKIPWLKGVYLFFLLTYYPRSEGTRKLWEEWGSGIQGWFNPSPLRFQVFKGLLPVSIFSVCYLIHRAGLHLGQSKGRNLGILPLVPHTSRLCPHKVCRKVFLLVARGGPA